MFQREVAERIVARARDKAYGRLGVLAGWRTEARILFDVSRSAFTPPPKVTSSVVQLIPRPDATEVPVAALEAITRAAFGQRRKMLRQSLKSLGVPLEPLLAAAGLVGDERPEQLPVSTFLVMAGAYAAARPDSSA
jgi:16S rRNA (adenine1518-N6/adenine1519-N6)-dimethyltransferase